MFPYARWLAAVSPFVLSAVAPAQPADIGGLFTPGAKEANGLQHLRVDITTMGALKGHEGAVRLRDVPLPTGDATLTLTRFNPFAPDARVILQQGEEQTLLPRPDAAYFRGETDDGDAAFVRVDGGNGIFAFVGGPGANAVVLKSQGAEGYVREANVEEQELYCTGGLTPAGGDTQGVRGEKGGLTDFRILVDMEHRLLRNVFEGDVTVAVEYVADVFGVVSAVYQRDLGVTLAVSDLVLWGEPAIFEIPLISASSPDYETMLDAYSAFDSTRNGYSRHLSHLLAYRLPSYAPAVGLAFVGALCSSSKQGSSTLNGAATAFDPDTNEADLMVVAHEIGHNFGANHSNDDTIMDAVNSGSESFSFGAGSVASMQAEIGSAPCNVINFEQCPPNSLRGHVPADPGAPLAFVISDGEQGQVLAELFDAPSAPVGTVRWWGAAIDSFDAPCVRFDDTFEITTFANEGGMPGDQLTTATVNAAPINTGITMDGYTLFEYEATLLQPLGSVDAWLSIKATGDGECHFHWVTSVADDGVHYQLSPTPTLAQHDLAFCLLPVVDVAPVPGLDCAEGSVYSQLPDTGANPFISFNRFISNSGADRFVEIFSGVSQPIGAVRWWGFNLNTDDDECTRSPDQFEISFRTTLTGSPVASFTVTPEREEIDIEAIPAMIQYTAELPESVDLSEGNVSIVGTGDSACKFSWVNSVEGDGKFHFTPNGVNFSFFNDIDAAFCLIAAEPTDGEGDGLEDGEGDGAVDGEGDGLADGEGDGLADGEGDGLADGEGDGAVDGEGDGTAEGEGDDEGGIEGDCEGFINTEAENFAPCGGEGEGEEDGENPLQRLVRLAREIQTVFHASDTNGDNRLSFEEIDAALPELTQGDFDVLDQSEDNLLRLLEVLVGRSGNPVASIDLNADFVVALTELLRIVQLYNAGTYGCDNGSEDGFSPVSGPDFCCAGGGGFVTCRAPIVVEDAEAGTVTLSDLLRAIQLFSFGEYVLCETENDLEYCPE